MSFTIEHKEYETKGSFIAIDETNKQAGEMTYSKAGADKIIIDHTDVDPAYGGQGVGKLLFEAAIAYVRSTNVKVIPLCPFATSMFQKNESFRDVLV